MTERAITRLYPAVVDRSGGRCEAVWHPGYRCRNRADEIQHRLSRAQGRHGYEHLLDAEALVGRGDVEHLAHLCAPCHRVAHDNPERAEAAHLSGAFGSVHPADLRLGIIVRGEVRTAPDGRIVYTGPHPGFSARWPP